MQGAAVVDVNFLQAILAAVTVTHDSTDSCTNNPGPFTYMGTGTYIVGRGQVGNRWCRWQRGVNDQHRRQRGGQGAGVAGRTLRGIAMDRATVTEFQQADGVRDWRVLDAGASAWFDAPSMAAI